MTITVVSVAGLVFVFVNFAKAVVNKDHNAWLTQLIVWAAGVIAVILIAHSQFGVGINFGGVLLAKTNWVDQILLGLFAGSAGSTVNEFKKAVDNKDTALTGPLFPMLQQPPVPAVPTPVAVNPATPKPIK